MKYLILVSVILLVVSCGKNDEPQQTSSNKNDEPRQTSSNAKQVFDLSTAKGLCLYVINEAEKEIGDTRPPTVVIEAYKDITCVEVTSKHIPILQCMKNQTDLGNGFYKADEYCAKIFKLTNIEYMGSEHNAKSEVV